MQLSVRLRSVRLARLIDAIATVNPTVQKMRKDRWNSVDQTVTRWVALSIPLVVRW